MAAVTAAAATGTRARHASKTHKELSVPWHVPPCRVWIHTCYTVCGPMCMHWLFLPHIGGGLCPENHPFFCCVPVLNSYACRCRRTLEPGDEHSRPGQIQTDGPVMAVLDLQLRRFLAALLHTWLAQRPPQMGPHMKRLLQKFDPRVWFTTLAMQASSHQELSAPSSIYLFPFT